ncbi:MAG: phosphate ABC transporter permease PstC, partial [Acetobacteraceae bacterium]
MSASVSPLDVRRARRRSGSDLADRGFRAAAAGAAWLVLVVLIAIAALMFYGGLPAFRAFGVHFLYGTEWNPVAKQFAAGVAIYGTLV